MAFWKLATNDVHIEEGPPLSTVERRAAQHAISNYLKKLSKEVFGHGAEGMRTAIIDDVVVVQMYGYLTPEEAFVAYSSDKGADDVRRIRLSGMDALVERGALVPFVEETVGARCLYLTASLAPLEQFGVFIFVMNRRLTE